MSNSVITINAVNLKNPTIIFWIILSFAISAFAFWLFIISFFSIITGVALIGVLFFPLVLIYSLRSKVIITDNAIIKKTPFKQLKINFKDIKSFGLYEQIPDSRTSIIIQPDEIDKSSFLSQNFMFLSKRKDYSPHSFKQSGVIRFHPTKEVYQHILNKTKQLTHQ